MKFYDINGDGNLSYEEFIKVLREPLNPRRVKIVDKAFASIENSDSGKVTAAAAMAKFNFSADPEFQRGKKSREEVLGEFASNFHDGVLTRQEFIDFYSDVSMTVTHDEQFVQLVETTWGIHEDEDAGVFKQ